MSNLLQRTRTGPTDAAPRSRAVPAGLAHLSLACFALAWLPGLATAQTAERDRALLDATAFGGEIVAVEILPLEERAATRDALADALTEINEVEALFDPYGEFPRSLGALNRGAGGEPVPLDDRVVEALRRSLLFCIWSENAHGPLGGVLYGAWSLRRPAGGSPDPRFVQQALEAASCDGLDLDPEASTGRLAAGARADLWGFAKGYAVDRAVFRLRAAGATSGWVQIGDVVRAFQDGSDQAGWQVTLDGTGPEDHLVERIVLHNRAIALAAKDQRPSLRIAGADWPPYLDQRTGTPIQDKTAVFVATEEAIDAQGLAVALFVQNHREGQYRAGQLSPRPAIKWLLGTIEPPVENSRGWADLPKWRPRQGAAARLPGL